MRFWIAILLAYLSLVSVYCNDGGHEDGDHDADDHDMDSSHYYNKEHHKPPSEYYNNKNMYRYNNKRNTGNLEMPKLNSTQCVYAPDIKMLSCKDFNERVDCDAYANFSAFDHNSFHIFGIGKIPIEMYSNSEAKNMKYFLYPRSFDNQTYYNYSIYENNQYFDLYLYYSENFEYYGFRVQNSKCYEKMVNMFKSSSENHMAKVNSNNTMIQTEASLFGEILSLDKEVQKRWLYGYYWPYGGWGWGGWGGWGLDWGFGWGGLGWGYWGK